MFIGLMEIKIPVNQYEIIHLATKLLNRLESKVCGEVTSHSLANSGWKSA